MWANKSENEQDARTLCRVAHCIVAKAAYLEAEEAGLYARLCQDLELRISDDVRFDGYSGGHLFALLVAMKLALLFDLVHGRCRCHASESTVGTRCRLALTRFLGELFNKDIISADGFVRSFIERRLANIVDPAREDLETVCELLTVAGSKLDTVERRATMDGYFDRMRAMSMKLSLDFRLYPQLSVSIRIRACCVRTHSRMQSIVDLRRRKWVPADT